MAMPDLTFWEQITNQMLFISRQFCFRPQKCNDDTKFSAICFDLIRSALMFDFEILIPLICAFYSVRKT